MFYRSKETRRGGKSYQEERQRLNERRLAAKGISSKPSGVGDGSIIPDKAETVSNEDMNEEKRAGVKKEVDTSSESRSRAHDKYRGSDKYQQQNSRESKRFEKPNKTGRDSDQKRNCDSKRNAEDRYQDDGKEVKKNVPSDRTDAKSESNPPKEETRKKSYNQEREQRRAAAAERKNPNSKENSKKFTSAEENQLEKERHPSLDNNIKKKNNITQDEPSRRKSVADIKSSQAASGIESSNEKQKGTSESRDDQDKKDPRAERRIRNKVCSIGLRVKVMKEVYFLHAILFGHIL